MCFLNNVKILQTVFKSNTPGIQLGGPRREGLIVRGADHVLYSPGPPSWDHSHDSCNLISRNVESYDCVHSLFQPIICPAKPKSNNFFLNHTTHTSTEHFTMVFALLPCCQSCSAHIQLPIPMALKIPATSSTPLSDKGFYAFPPEIREIIFQHHFAGSGGWRERRDGKTPVLIKALHKSKLQIEAIEAFTQRKAFKLWERNGWDLREMPPVFSSLEIAFPR